MSGVREIPAEDSIKVVCRFRPLNDSEELAGSKFVVKFPSGPEENCLSIGVSNSVECGRAQGPFDLRKKTFWTGLLLVLVVGTSICSGDARPCRSKLRNREAFVYVAF
uniref:Kinesin motor domain-containing protein n=1 Tax=Anopheles maculatus TaxID=74869 RepID=A0A182S6Q0_9DIPT